MSASESFPALGGIATVAVAEPDALSAAAGAVRGTVSEFDRACSRFRADSELSTVNHRAGAAVPVGDVLLEAVAVALRAAELTAGAVDPTVGGALIALGYDRDFDQLLTRGPHAVPPARVHACAVPGWRTVELDVERSTIRLAPGTRLDLGATAKALAADRAAGKAARAVGCGVLVSLSGDLAIAGTPPAEGWHVRVTDDHRAGPDAPGQTVVLNDGGLATSSTQSRRWPSSQGEVHHVLDPTSGWSAVGPWRTVSVAAATCAEANMASTAAIVRGAGAVDWLAPLGLPARLVSTQGLACHLGDWPRQGEDLPLHGRSAVPAA
jgi:FAD:protein FMN transferase